MKDFKGNFFGYSDFKHAINKNISFGESAEPSGQYISVANAISISNALMNKFINSWPKVYGKPVHRTNPDPSDLNRYQWGASRLSHDTHQAYLAFVEKIPTDCVDHEPVQWTYVKDHKGPEFTCAHCGVEIKPHWVTK